MAKKKGGKRPGAGRPVASATLEAQLAREIIAQESKDHWIPITRKAISQAKKGNKDARAWLADRVIGKPNQAIDHTTGGERFGIQIISFDANTDS